jgi:hypothetical protein
MDKKLHRLDRLLAIHRLNRAIARQALVDAVNVERTRESEHDNAQGEVDAALALWDDTVTSTVLDPALLAGLAAHLQTSEQAFETASLALARARQRTTGCASHHARTDARAKTVATLVRRRQVRLRRASDEDRERQIADRLAFGWGRS